MLKSAAYSLLELLLVLAVSALLLSLAIPAYNSLLAWAQSQQYLAKVIDSIEFARQEAVKRSTIISLCAVDVEQHCIQTQQWSQGYIVYLNPRQQDQPEQPLDILRYYPAPKKSVDFYWDRPKRAINFSADGSMDYQHGTFSYRVNNHRKSSWDLIINPSGRVRVAEPDKVIE